MTLRILLPDHPLLAVRAVLAEFPVELGALPAPSPLSARPRWPLAAPTNDLRAVVRDLLRHTGWKPTGRSKPSSEYLTRADGESRLTPINFAVDAGNLASLLSGLPISVVDAARLQPPLRIEVARPGTGYVFNRAGQTIEVGGLVCLHDAAGPCANPVKDAQRTKTVESTRTALSLIWSSSQLRAYTDATEAFYRELLRGAGAGLLDVELDAPD